MSIHINKPVHINSLFSKDTNLNFKYSHSLRDRDFQDRDSKKSSNFSDDLQEQNFALDVELQKLGKPAWA